MPDGQHGCTAKDELFKHHFSKKDHKEMSVFSYIYWIFGTKKQSILLYRTNAYYKST